MALVVAGAVAAGVGLFTYYLARLLLAREKMPGAGPPHEVEGDASEGGGA